MCALSWLVPYGGITACYIDVVYTNGFIYIKCSKRIIKSAIQINAILMDTSNTCIKLYTNMNHFTPGLPLY